MPHAWVAYPQALPPANYKWSKYVWGEMLFNSRYVQKSTRFQGHLQKKCVFSWLLLLPSWILRNAALHQVSSMSISSFDKFQKFPRPAQPKLDSCLKRVLMIRNILKVVLLPQMKFKGMYKDADPVYCMQRCWNSWRIMANGYAMDGVESNFVVTSA